MALLDELVDFVSDNTSNGSWQKPNLKQRSAEFLATHDMGGGLPEVTDADNGDVLTVVEGQWAKSAPSGGVMFVQATEDPELGEGVRTLNKTYNELQEAVENGMFPVAVISYEDEYGATTEVALLMGLFMGEGQEGVTYDVAFGTAYSVLTYSASTPDGVLKSASPK